MNRRRVRPHMISSVTKSMLMADKALNRLAYNKVLLYGFLHMLCKLTTFREYIHLDWSPDIEHLVLKILHVKQVADMAFRSIWVSFTWIDYSCYIKWSVDTEMNSHMCAICKSNRTTLYLSIVIATIKRIQM